MRGVLDHVSTEGRVRFFVVPGGKTIEVGESCDGYYRCFLTKTEFSEMIVELTALRDTMGD